jgi:hypothetical protein
MKVPGYAENMVFPRCHTYTRQRIVASGVRECGQRLVLSDTERIQHGTLKKPGVLCPHCQQTLDPTQTPHAGPGRRRNTRRCPERALAPFLRAVQ